MNNASHAALTVQWSHVLKSFAAAHRMPGRVLVEAGVYTQSSPLSARAPDVAYISLERLPKLPAKGFLDVMPELLVEIISPDNGWSDTFEKIYEYFERGAQLVWIADPFLREVRTFSSPRDVQVLRAANGDSLTGDQVLPGFSASVADMFEV